MFLGVEKGCIGSKWLNIGMRESDLSYLTPWRLCLLHYIFAGLFFKTKREPWCLHTFTPPAPSPPSSHTHIHTPLSFYPPLGPTQRPPFPTVTQSISPPPPPSPQEMLVHDFWKGQNCQVADKWIDTTFTINIL